MHRFAPCLAPLAHPNQRHFGSQLWPLVTIRGCLGRFVGRESWYGMPMVWVRMGRVVADVSPELWVSGSLTPEPLFLLAPLSRRAPHTESLRLVFLAIGRSSGVRSSTTNDTTVHLAPLGPFMIHPVNVAFRFISKYAMPTRGDQDIPESPAALICELDQVMG